MTLPQGWTHGRLGELCSIEIGGTPSRSVPAYWDSERETSNIWVSIKDMRQRVIERTAEHITDLGAKRSNVKLQKPGTVLLSFKLSIGRVAIAGVPLYTNEAIAGLVPTGLTRDFLYHGLQSWDLLQGVDQAIKGATLNKQKLKRIEFQYPTEEREQAKIAEVLSTVDRAIEQTEAIIVKQQRVKTGLMQDLLTRGIDELGNLRSEDTHEFKDSPLGRIPAEWDVKTVVETGSVCLGRQLSPKYMRGKHPAPYLRVANVFDGWIDYGDVLAMDFTEREKAKYWLRPGDVLLNEGQSRELVGRSAIFDGPPSTYCFQNTLIRYRANEGMCPRFAQMVFKYWLDTGTFADVARQTTSVAHLGADRFARMLISRPDPDEQARIVAVLGGVDLTLNTEEQKLNKLRSVKTGLMQDLLTGNRRVTSLLESREVVTA